MITDVGVAAFDNDIETVSVGSARHEVEEACHARPEAGSVLTVQVHFLWNW